MLSRTPPTAKRKSKPRRPVPGDAVRVPKRLLDCPRLRIVAERLGANRLTVVGAVVELVRLISDYSGADRIDFADRAYVDEQTLPGFAAAAEAAGWLAFDDGGVALLGELAEVSA